MNLAPTIKPSQSGQALVEYVLLVVVVVGIAVGLASKFFTPVQKWVDFYMGDYTQCLLDNGLLPGTEADSPNTCNQMALNAGFGADGTVSGKAFQDPSASSAATKAAAAKAAAASKFSLASTGSGSSSSRRARIGGGGRSGGPPSFPEAPSESKGASDGTGGTTKYKFNDKSSFRSYSSNEAGTSRPVERTPISAVSRFEPNEPVLLESKVEKAAREHQEEEAGLRPRKMAIRFNARKTASFQDADADFSFGGLLRMAIICIIVVAIIYVVSTQVNSVMKGMEK